MEVLSQSQKRYDLRVSQLTELGMTRRGERYGKWYVSISCDDMDVMDLSRWVIRYKELKKDLHLELRKQLPYGRSTPNRGFYRFRQHRDRRKKYPGKGF